MIICFVCFEKVLSRWDFQEIFEQIVEFYLRRLWSIFEPGKLRGLFVQLTILDQLGSDTGYRLKVRLKDKGTADCTAFQLTPACVSCVNSR
jgi:hypothetical protein